MDDSPVSDNGLSCFLNSGNISKQTFFVAVYPIGSVQQQVGEGQLTLSLTSLERTHLHIFFYLIKAAFNCANTFNKMQIILIIYLLHLSQTADRNLLHFTERDMRNLPFQ